MIDIETARQTVRVPEGCTDYDDELRSLIRECAADLEAAGVTAPASLHPRFDSAAKAYLKAYFGGGDDDSERWEKVYCMRRDSMALDKGAD